MRFASGAGARRKRGKLAALFVGVGVFASVVSFGPPPPERRAAEPSVAELSARAERLFDRGEVGEAIEVARRAAEAAPEQPTAWAVLGSLHASAGHDAQARASFVACVAHTRAREVEACNAALTPPRSTPGTRRARGGRARR